MTKKVMKHQFINQDFYIPNWKIKFLLLGTFNPSDGEKVNYYYGRTRNQTWKLLSEIFKVNIETSDPNFIEIIKANGIACMDLIETIEFDIKDNEYVIGKGYGDSKIINGKVNRKYNTENVIAVKSKNPDVKVYSTWGKGSNLKEWINEVDKLGSIINLVSPSMAAKVDKGVAKFPYMLNDWRNKILYV